MTEQIAQHQVADPDLAGCFSDGRRHHHRVIDQRMGIILSLGSLDNEMIGKDDQVIADPLGRLRDRTKAARLQVGKLQSELHEVVLLFYCCWTASTSIEIDTSSPTSTPPVSIGLFHTTPKSLRSILVVADAPARVAPAGSLIGAVVSTTSTTGLVTPCSVRAPVTFHWPVPPGSTLVDLKVIVGYLSTSRKAALFKWASRFT